MDGSKSKWVSFLVGAGLLASSVATAAAALPVVERAEFGDYELVPLLDDAARYAGPATPNALDEVRISRLVDEQLPPGARERLAEQGFVVVPSELRLFHDAYRDQDGSGTPVFVTTDAAYHSWHLVFDKILRDVEQRRLLPALEQLVEGMRENAARQRDELARTALADDAARIHDLLATTASLLELDGGKLSRRARAEKTLIEAHAASTESPILGTPTDYTLFTPRGHYTRNAGLTRYFVAMSVLGQHAFLLPGAVLPGGAGVVTSLDGLRRAVLASRTLVGDAELEGLWRRVFEPSAFLVGVSDDYTPFELVAAVEAIVPGGWADPRATTDDATLMSVADALTRERPVRIDPERPSVRLMGTRFVLDSWILDQLVSPNVDTRVLGSALDVAAAFGSDFALAIQEAAGETAKAGYTEQMTAMRDAVAARPDEAWGRTVYDAWLAAVEPMWLPRGEAFPDFMRSDAWAKKSQQTGFGSYAELRHDTILYTKQAFGDTTGGGPLPRPARNWVEPDPVPFRRLSAMATLMRAGLEERELLPDDQRELLDDYVAMVDRFGRIAADELAGDAISDEDNDWLGSIESELEGLWMRSGDRSELDLDAAVIADIMRGLDVQAGTDEVLEVGTGFVDRIYVVVPDDVGRFSVASGGVYSYHEFRWPTSDRLTDERWREMLRTGDVPDRPTWQETLYPGRAPGTDRAPQSTAKPTRQVMERKLGRMIEGATWEPYRQSPAGVTFDPFESGAVAAVLFDGLEAEFDRGVDFVALFRFRSADQRDWYWAERSHAVESEAPMRTTPCADGRPGRDVWLHGEYLCYVSDAHVAQLRWTDERTDSYGVMNAVAGQRDLERLYRSWESIVSEADA